jgi:histidinol phosphatase-like enzyme (inositol monophosphatase family)
LDADIALAQRLADAAAAEIRPHFRHLAAVETKADASPVTVADRAAEAAIRAILARERPADGVIGEEYGEDRPDAARVWVIDPIDGTRAFVTGRPLFGTLVALLADGVPVIGVLDQCITGDRWVGATGRPTTLRGVAAGTRACPTLASAHVGTTSPYLFDDPAAFARVRAAARDVIYGGDCYNYGLVASGHLDLVVESGLKVYDWAALVPIVTGAGGAMTDWAGEPLRRGSDGRVIATGDPVLLSAVISTLSP